MANRLTQTPPFQSAVATKVQSDDGKEFSQRQSSALFLPGCFQKFKWICNYILIIVKFPFEAQMRTIIS
jgi:hypothetical protein